MTTPFTSDQSDDDLSGSRLKSLVCKGHCLITKVLKISNELPLVFLSGYTIDDFTTVQSSSTIGKNNPSKKKKETSDSSTGFSFFGSTVLNIFGSSTKVNSDCITKKIRSQAPSYKQSCNSQGQSGNINNSSSSSSQSNYEVDSGDSKFKPIIVDFSYLSNPDKFDRQEEDNNNLINDHVLSASSSSAAATMTTPNKTIIMNQRRKSAAEQEQLEREFAMKYQSILKKYYGLFEDIHNYYIDVHSFTSDLDDGHLVQYNLQSLLLESSEARKLLCEALYLSGTLLILLDMYIPGEIRERLIIAHYRFCDTSDRNNSKTSNFEELCKMFQRSDYHQNTNHNSTRSTPVSSKKTKRRDDDSALLQPQIQTELLSRIPISPKVIQSIIECLLTVDLYPDQSFAFPSYDQRSSRLAHQGAMLVIVLFFNPMLLKKNTIMMRQVVDRFFPQSWMVPLYNGALIDLSIEWNSRFPAAMGAIEHVIDALNIERLNYENMKGTISCIDEVKRYLAPKALTTTFLLDHGKYILDFLRKANIALRWQILHGSSHLYPKSSDSTAAMIVDEHDILSLILLISQLEVQLVEAYHIFLNKKEHIWIECKENAVEKLMRLSRHFSGDDSLKTVEKNEDVGRWFEQMVEEIQSLDSEKKHIGGAIQVCIEALDEVKRLDLIDSNLQSLNIIEEVRTNLLHMAKSVIIKEDICKIIDLIADFTYAREIIERQIPMVHSTSMRDPKSVTLLRAFFLKLGRPHPRLQFLVDDPHNDLGCVTEFHESAMLAFVKETLDVIPITIFSTLAHIADKKSLAQLPSKIEAESLVDYLHFKERYNLAKITYELSVLTKGIFAMKKTLIGNLEIKPKGLLEEGLRKELVRQYSNTLHNQLQFFISSERTKEALINHINACTEIFNALGNRIEGFQRSMIWLQDFLEVDGLNIFTTETSHIMRLNVQRELVNLNQDSSVNTNLLESDDNTVPTFARTDGDKSAATFLGRTMNALIHLTDPKFTVYSNSLKAWYFSSGDQVCGMRMIALLRNAIGNDGLIGLEKLFCCKIRIELTRLFKFYGNIKAYGAILEQFRDTMFPEWKSPTGGIDIYEIAMKKISKLMVPLTKSFSRIGQFQLLRKMIWNELRIAADAKTSHSCTVANKLLMLKYSENNHDIVGDPSAHVFSDLIVSHGQADPMATVFVRSNSMEGLPSLIALFVIQIMGEMSYDNDFGALVSKEDVSLDGWSIVAGVSTVLKQFNASYTKTVFALLCQYVTCTLSNQLVTARAEDLPRISRQAQNVLIFMRQLCSIASLESTILFDHIPQHLLEMIAVISN